MGTSYENASLKDFSKNIILYERSEENFPNPERGFFIAIQPLGNDTFKPLQLSQLKRLRKQNMSLVRRIYLLEDFRDKPISQSLIDLIKEDLNVVRQAGVKIIIRFSYNWLGGGKDASKSIVMSHLEQLKPILESNYDAIAYMEAGFIGFWGEWHSSSNGLDRSREDRREILFKILSVLPSNRMVALRYPYYKIDAFNNTNPLNPREAFNGSYRARTGAHNDCLLAGLDDWGTYNSLDLKEIANQKRYLSLDNRYLVQGGELCNVSDYDDCPNALNELAKMRWSALNANPDDGAEIIEDWRRQGCLGEIQRSLGYRLTLLKTVISSRIKPGSTFDMDFEVINNGWASLYNPRRLEIILRNNQTNEEFYLPLNQDPRMWMPGSKNLINIVGGIPDNMPIGEYQVFLNLPDPTPKLYNRPEYSIQLANKNLWESSTGYNSLLTNIYIDKDGEKLKYSGNLFFQKLKK